MILIQQHIHILMALMSIFLMTKKLRSYIKDWKRKNLQIIINNKTYTDNSNEANENSVFVVSKQNEKFVDAAKSKGCTEIIQAKDLDQHFDMSSIKVIGITGTNGKTTTAAAIYSFLLDLGYKVALQGTR